MLSGLFAIIISDQLSVWVLNIFIHATVLTAAALLISLLFRRSAVMRYWVLCFGLAFVSVSPVTYRNPFISPCEERHREHVEL